MPIRLACAWQAALITFPCGVLRDAYLAVGPYPSLKIPTVIARTTQTNIQGGLLFFRTSAAARATPRFLHEVSMLPPLAYSVCVRTLSDFSSSSQCDGLLEVHFADEEGDPYAVALAGRLGAYVAGRDSDFVVLNAEGYRGYIPLDEMVWSAVSFSPAISRDGSVYSSANGDMDEYTDEGGFKIVRKSKTRKRAAANHRVGRGLIPPNQSTGPDLDLTLTVTVYTPASLATHLDLPVSLLPLLGALVGNDFTGAPDDSATSSSGQRPGIKKNNWQHLFFERQLTLVQRISKVATTLRSILVTTFISQANGTPRKKRQKNVGSVMELIDAALSALLLRSPDSFATGERETIVERIVEATLQYAIPRYEGPDCEDHDDNHNENEERKQNTRIVWASDVCILHAREACPLFTCLSRSFGTQQPLPESSHSSNIEGDQALLSDESESGNLHARVRTLYVAAYRRGELDPHVLDAVNTGKAWPRMFLEDPDKESVARSIARPIREWCYALLGAGIELSEVPGSEQGSDEGHSEDELIDVEEENDEDFLAPLRGALKRLDGSGQDDNDVRDASVSSANLKPVRPKVVMEYVRRGTRLAAEEVSVPSLKTVLADFSMSSPDELPESLALPLQLWPEDERITFFLRALGSDTVCVRALQGGRLSAVLAIRWVVMRMHVRACESDSNKEKGKERWTSGEAKAFLMAFSWSSSGKGLNSEDQRKEPLTSSVPILERNIHLISQLCAALDAIEHFAQILLLVHRVPSPMQHFSGLRFHASLTGAVHKSVDGIDEGLWGACIEGLGDAFREEKNKKGRKERKKEPSGSSISSTATKKHTIGSVQQQGMFDLLAEADV